MNVPERQPWSSGAKIDATTLVLMVDAEALRGTLAPLGLTINALPGVPSGRHPVCIDLWHVDSGRIDVAGIDQHGWFAATGGAAGTAAGVLRGVAVGSSVGAIRGAASGATLGSAWGPFGRVWGAALGWAAGGVWGVMDGAVAGVAQETAAGAAVAQALSEAASRVIATYDEIVVGIPNVVRPKGLGPHMYVLGMVSNGTVSIWGDRALGCGYQKRVAEIDRHGFKRYEVHDGRGARRLTALLSPAPDDSWVAPDDRLKAYRLIFAQPLLGHLGGQRFAVTFLDRLLDDVGIRWAPASARLTIAPGFIDGLPGGMFEVPALSSEDPWGAFQVSGVLTKITLTKGH